MSSTKSIKQRIRSVKNTSQITKAMEVVSATKMRRSQESAIRARPYAAASLEILKNLLLRTTGFTPLLLGREVKRSCLLVVSSDKGLAGAFNSNVIKKAEEWVNIKKGRGLDFTLVVTGKKARDYFEKRNLAVHACFLDFSDHSTLEETVPVAETLIEGFLLDGWDEVEAVYTSFRSTLKQEAVLRKVLPVTKEGIQEVVEGIFPEKGRYAQTSKSYELKAKSYNYEYKFEPSPEEILGELVPQLIKMHIHHIILESNASEHSARMVAMKNASESAGELISDLTLVYNKVRQAGITRELTEITAGKEALEL